MLKYLSVIAALLIAGAANAEVERPKPLTATLVGVCENRLQKLMVAVFTFEDGKVLVVDGKNMQGFDTAADIIRYAATAGHIGEYAQNCGDTST